MSRCITQTFPAGRVARVLIAVVIAASAAAGRAAATVYYVHAGAPGGNGLTWDNANPNLQAILGIAVSGDEIRVGRGTYLPSELGGGRSASYLLKNGVAIRGGYGGRGHPTPDVRNFTLTPSILSGDLNANDSGGANTGENSYHVARATAGINSTAILDGFTIRAGNANGADPIDNRGGGMRIDNAAPTILNCRIEFCTSAAFGAGVLIDAAALAPTFTDCTFFANQIISTATGGGVNCGQGSPQFTRCRFENNIATASGGGGSFLNGQPQFVDCDFIGNMAGGGGSGGALSLGGSFTIAQVSGCFFHGNLTGTGDGGAIEGARSSHSIVNCVFTGNQAQGDGGAIRFTSTGTGTPVIANCTFVGNTAGVQGGAIRSDTSGAVDVRNSILWGNSAPSGPQVSGVLTTSHCCVEGGSAGTGNISADPLLWDANGVDNIYGNADDEVRLPPYSPCIDAGDSALIPGGVTTDAYGNARAADDPVAANTGLGSPPVDIGAHERPATAPPVRTWTGGGGKFNNLFNLGANWAPPSVVPGVTDEARFVLGGFRDLVFSASVNNELLTATGSPTPATFQMLVGSRTYSVGRLIASNSNIQVVSGTMRVGYAALADGNSGLHAVSAGRLEIVGFVDIGPGVLNASGGDIDTAAASIVFGAPDSAILSDGATASVTLGDVLTEGSLIATNGGDITILGGALAALVSATGLGSTIIADTLTLFPPPVDGRFHDTLESDMGWTAGAVGDTVSTGLWVRVDPVGTTAQPEDDATTGLGTICFITGNGVPGGAEGAQDVDGGFTTLISPAMNCSGAGQAFVSYRRWFSDNLGAAPNTDSMTVEISNNDGASWTLLETVTEDAGLWVSQAFRVADFVPPTSQVRLRFIARDEGLGSLVEAGVDDVRAYMAGASSTPHTATTGLLQALTRTDVTPGAVVSTNSIRVRADASPATTGLRTPILSIGDGASITTEPGFGYAQHATGRLEIALSASTDSPLVANGESSLAGVLAITKDPAFNPQVGSTFVLVSGGSWEGRFDLAFLPGFPDNRFFRVDYTGVSPLRGGDAITLVVDRLGADVDFTPSPNFPLLGDDPTGVALADFNDDGFLDAAISLPTGMPTPGSVQVLLNAGNDVMGNWLGFSGSVQVTVGVDPSAVAAADLNNDNIPDFAVANAGNDSVRIYHTIPNGGGPGIPSFSLAQTITVGDQPSALEAADLVGDARIDLAVANRGDDNVMILENAAIALALSISQTIATGDEPTTIDSGDMDNDKDIDVIVGNSASVSPAGSVSVTLNVAGTFAASVNYPVGPMPAAALLADADDDGLLDAVTSNSGANTLSILRNTGGGALGVHQEFSIGDEPTSLAALDIDNDGDTDIVAVALDDMDERVVRLLRNNSTGPGLVVFDAPEDILIGQDTVLVQGGDLDDDGRDDVVAVNSAGGVLLASAGSDGVGSLDGSARGGPAGSVTVLLNRTVPIDAADLNADGVVNSTDLALLLGAWGACPPQPAVCGADLSGDGAVGSADLALLLGGWG